MAFSNSSTVLRDVCLSQRYETVSLGWAVGTRYDDAGDIEVDQDSLLKQQKVVREMLEDLAADEGKLACVRTLRVLEYSWYGEREMQLLEKIVRGATGLGTVQMVRSLGLRTRFQGADLARRRRSTRTRCVSPTSSSSHSSGRPSSPRLSCTPSLARRGPPSRSSSTDSSAHSPVSILPATRSTRMMEDYQQE